MATVSVLLPLPLPKLFDFLVPEDMELEEGALVYVPFGRRKTLGVVWDNPKPPQTNLPYKLKPIDEHIDLPGFSSQHKKFIEWVSQYTLTPVGQILKMMLPTSLKQEKQSYENTYSYQSQSSTFKMTANRKKVIDCLQNTSLREKELLQISGVSKNVIREMAKQNIIQQTKIIENLEFTQPVPGKPLVSFSDEQKVAIQKIKNQEVFKPILIDGVTGSGKTEVYFELIAETLRKGKQVLVMLPEIALTSQWLDRFEKRFSAPPSIWHSNVSLAKKKKTWRGILEGQCKVIVGARSALFLPYSDLGLIIIDEEHDQSYKQEESILYNARDMAIVRAKIENIPIVLATATPSLESYVNAISGRYDKVKLNRRVKAQKMPDVNIIDLKKSNLEKNKWISPELHKSIQDTLSKKEQSLLFLNRRGYAPLTLCRACGHRMKCPDCSAWLVEHRQHKQLHCHHCDYQIPFPQSCPECHESDSFTACGPGVERLEEEVKQAYPDANVMTLTSDSLGSSIDGQQFVQDVTQNKIDILIGTQILAKGYHFPDLTLVGVIDADIGLAGGDPRASEKTFQLMQQVAGRAGREHKSGHVYLQTWSPESPVIQALSLQDRQGFYDQEIMCREAMDLPPFGKLVALIISSPHEQQAKKMAQILAEKAPHKEEEESFIRVFGPAPAPMSLLRGKYRFRLLVKTSKDVIVQPVIVEWLNQVRVPSTVKIQIDIDPISFF